MERLKEKGEYGCAIDKKFFFKCCGKSTEEVRDDEELVISSHKQLDEIVDQLKRSPKNANAEDQDDTDSLIGLLNQFDIAFWRNYVRLYQAKESQEKYRDFQPQPSSSSCPFFNRPGSSLIRELEQSTTKMEEKLIL